MKKETMVELFRRTDYDYVCSFLVETSPGEFEEHQDASCHGSLDDYRGNSDLISIISSLWYSSRQRTIWDGCGDFWNDDDDSEVPWETIYISRKEAERYWKFIFDPEKSPWKLAIKKPIKYIRHPKSKRAVAFKISDLDVPYSVLVDLLCASRQPWEAAHKVKTWIILQDKYKMNPYEALVVSSHLFICEGYAYRDTAGVHSPFSAGRIDYQRVKDGNPWLKNKGVSIKKAESSYRPMDAIWDMTNERILDGEKKTGMYERYMWEPKESSPFPDLCTTTELYTGVFPAHFKTEFGNLSLERSNKYGPADEVIKKIMDNKEKWQ